MNELLVNIDNHKEKNNAKICEELYYLIKNNNIKDEETLKMIEDSHFNTTDVKKRNEIKINAYYLDPTHLEKFDQNVISKLDEYEKIYESTSDELVKTKCIIFIYDLIDWSFPFPYTAYKLILLDMLK